MSYSVIDIFLENNIEIELSNSIDETDFTCIQPKFKNGVYEGSKFVLIDASGLPDGLRIYMNSGEFAIVKDEVCMIVLNNPMQANTDVMCFINTANCQVESCTYTVGSLISGNFVCSTDSNSPIPGTLTGAFVCNPETKDLHQEVFNEFGETVMGEIYFEDCLWCGGTLPNCEEVP